MSASSSFDAADVAHFFKAMPLIADAALVPLADDPVDDREGVLCVVIKPDIREDLSQCFVESRLAAWNQFFDHTYQQHWDYTDPTLNATGWLNNYTNEPYAESIMQDWVGDVTERIVQLKPKNVLELGCGSGMLLLKLAASCQSYVGTDISPACVAALKAQIAATASLSNATVLERDALDFSGFEDEQFDTVILNSVIQYFPTTDYLVRVLEGATRVLAPGGAILLGDIRSRRLLRTFYADIFTAHRRDANMSLREAVNFHCACQHELLLDPQFVGQVQLQLPQLGRAEVHLQRGKTPTEMNRYRYHVCFFKAPPVTQPEIQRIDASTWAMQQVSAFLEDFKPAQCLFTGLRNGRLVAAREIEASVFGFSVDQREGTCPEALFGLAERLGYRLTLGPSTTGIDSMDALFSKGEHHAVLPVAEKAQVSIPLKNYATETLLDYVMGVFTEQWRRQMADAIFVYKQPRRFLLMPVLPRLPDGRLDQELLKTLVTQHRKILSSDGLAPLDAQAGTLKSMVVTMLTDLFLDHRAVANHNEMVLDFLLQRITLSVGVQLSAKEVIGKGCSEITALIEERLHGTVL